MRITIRWEIIPSFMPWALPDASLLGPPIASGSVIREDWDADAHATTSDPAAFAPSDPITVPLSAERAAFHILRLETFGSRGWLLAIGTPEHLPEIGDGNLQEVDAIPIIYIPGSYQFGVRSIDCRAIRPGASFIVRPVKDPL